MRNWKTLIIINLLPVIFLVISFLQAGNFEDVQPIPLTMTLDSYARATVVLQKDNFTPEAYQTKMIQNYQNFFKDAPETRNLIEINQDFQAYILKESETILPIINNQYILGASITQNNVTAWFNNQPYHAAPLTVNMMYNTILKLYCANCEISVTNHPLPVSFESKVNQHIFLHKSSITNVFIFYFFFSNIFSNNNYNKEIILDLRWLQMLDLHFLLSLPSLCSFTSKSE